MHLQTKSILLQFGIENAAAHFQDSRAKIHSKAAIHTKMNCFSGIARGFRPHKASAAQAVAAFFTRLFYHRQKALSSTFYAFCGKNMTQLLQSHFVRQLPQGGSLWQYGQLFGCARASLSEKDFPRPGQILPAPGRNVTAGDKEENRCHASDKKGNSGIAQR